MACQAPMQQVLQGSIHLQAARYQSLGLVHTGRLQALKVVQPRVGVQHVLLHS